MNKWNIFIKNLCYRTDLQPVVKLVIIEIDGFYCHALLSGKKYSKKQLKQMYWQSKQLTCDPKDFHYVFCRLYNFEKINFSEDIEVNFVLDIDTDRIYSPTY